jgi:hypothetical protein
MWAAFLALVALLAFATGATRWLTWTTLVFSLAYGLLAAAGGALEPIVRRVQHA